MDILTERIEKVYPNIGEVRRKKLAQENARYFIDVAGPYTSMVYTTTYRQWSYIAQWFDKFINANSNIPTQFREALIMDFTYIRDFIVSSGIGNINKLNDIKSRTIPFLSFQNNKTLPTEEQYGKMYLVNYDCSFSCLAQAQRHRTLNYTMYFNDLKPDEYEFYIPEIVSDLAEEWIADMRNLVVHEILPQGILVKVSESGDVNNFILKCEERLCGRAQREVAILTRDTLNKLYFNSTGEVQDILQSMYIPEQRCKAKCELIGTCSETCEFGPVYAVDRVI
jgi:hypothetical protein